ncbi:MAG TPA: AAA family ATPase, partial [Anaerolineae bacterium]|nr:AAA family ATPase [Anaerolineae bacterium]
MAEQIQAAGTGVEQKQAAPPTFQVPAELPILPLREAVLYPLTVSPLVVAEARSIKLVDEAALSKRPIGMVAVKEDEMEKKEVGPEDLHEVGTVAMLMGLRKTPDGTVFLIAQGMERIRVREFIQTEPYLVARVEAAPDQVEETIELKALMHNVSEAVRRLISLMPQVPNEVVMAIAGIGDPRQLAYVVAANLRLEMADAQEILGLDSVRDKLHKLMTLLDREIEVMELGQKIRTEAQSEMEKMQREYFLREQLKAIKKELGEEDEQSLEVEEYRQKIAEAGMPEEVEKEAKRELDRLARMPTAAAEYSVIKTYLDWLTDLPWNVATEDNLDIARARRILDEDHYDLEKIKERILEYLAVRKMRVERQPEREDEEEPKDYIRRERQGAILCFVGPPGTGKTSLGQSIARALGRKFVRMSLGGVRDEAEIRGFRRTYVGALPGRIIQAIRRVGSKNPVFMLDEVDK